MPVTAAELTALAERLDADALEALRAGDRDLAADLATAAEANRRAARGLQAPKRLGRIPGVTPGQLERRAQAIAKAHAKKSPKDAFLAAVSSSRWRSMNRYAKEALGGVSAASLTLYRQGVHPVPKWIADRVREDLGLEPTRRIWPAGVAE